MALVSYDYGSDSSDAITDDESDQPAISKVILDGPSTSTKTVAHIEPVENGLNIHGESTLFSKLPEVKPSSSEISAENDQLEDFIPTVKTLREKKKVQILIPSLSDFDDSASEEPVPKKLKPSQRGSGLLGLLPPVQTVPNSNTMFVPNTLRKPSSEAKPTTVTKMIPHSVKKAQAAKKVEKIKADSDSETDTEDVPIPDTFDDEMWEKVCGRPKPTPRKIKLDMTSQQNEEEFSIAPEPKKPYEGLDNVAFKELVGKTKKPIGNIKLIDINEDEILPDRDLWMTKSLTDPDLGPKVTMEEVDPTRRRKHHITYLAEKAKANEQELKAAWATSRNNRMMSRSKYGF